MHNAIFTVVDVTDGDLSKDELEELGCPYEAYELFDHLGGVTDSVSEDAGSWTPKDLTDSLKDYSFVKVLADDTFELSDNNGYISKEIERRIEKIQHMLKKQKHDDALTHYRACKILNDNISHYVISIDRKGYENDFQTMDSFILDGFNAGKKYKVVAINDYHA